MILFSDSYRLKDCLVFGTASLLFCGVSLAAEEKAEEALSTQEAVLWPDPQPRKKEELLISEKRLNAHEDVASIPLSYNFDRNIGSEHKGTTNLISVQPYVPFRLTEDYSFIVFPSLTYQYFENFDGKNAQALKPVILQTYIAQSGQSTLRTSYGFGPMVAIPTGAGPEFGSRQTGVGYSFAGFHRTERWVVGLLGYQSFATSSQLNVPSANNVFVHPTIKFITSKAGSIALDSEAFFNTDGQGNSIPVNLMGSKIINFGSQPFLLTLGVRYWAVNSTYGGAQGWGGRLALTYSFAN